MIHFATRSTKRAILIWLLVASAPAAYAQTEKKDIHASIAGFFNGLSLVNVDSMKYYTTLDFHLLEDGQVWNMDTLLKKVLPRRNASVERINRFEFIRTEQQGDLAWVTYNNSAQFRVGEKQQLIMWLESAVLVRNKGRWQIQLLHSTKLK